MWTKLVKTENNTKRIAPFFTLRTHSDVDIDDITPAVTVQKSVGKGYTVVEIMVRL